MSGDQDLFDFDDGSSRSARKSGASSSRRRGNKPPKALDDDLDLDQLVGAQSSNFDSINVSNSMSRPPQPQPRRNSKTKDSVDDVNVFGGANEATKGSKSSNASKAINSWGDDRPAVTTRHRSPKFGLNDLRLWTFRDSVDNKEPTLRESTSLKQTREINDTEELDIPEIPDLEETIEQDENIAFKIAEAPDIQVHQISTYKELDKEFFKEKAFQFLEGNIDVSLLHCGLSTEQQIAEEEDVVWDWTKLFTEVVSILTADVKQVDEFSTPSQPTTNGGDEFGASDAFDIVRPTNKGKLANKREIDFT